MSDPVSSTRLYLGNLPRDVTKEDIIAHFQEGPGTISEIKLMNGFGFVEFEDEADARDVVPNYHGSNLKGNRLTVQFARGPRPRDYPPPHATHPRPRRTAFRMQIAGLPGDTSWQDLKDFARRSGLDVVYSEVDRDRGGKGFVEFETAGDLKIAVDKLDNQEFKGNNVRCEPNIQEDIPGRSDRYRSRSPPHFRGRGGYPPPGGYYEERGRGPPPGRGYSPRRDDYRRRSPLARDDGYYGGHGGYRSPPPRGPPRGLPPDEVYGPPRGGYGREADPYDGGIRRRGGYEESYATNGYERAPRRTPPPPRGYGGGYGERPPPRYW